MYHNEGNDNGGSGIADEMRDKVDKFLDVRTSSWKITFSFQSDDLTLLDRIMWV